MVNFSKLKLGLRRRGPATNPQDSDGEFQNMPIGNTDSTSTEHHDRLHDNESTSTSIVTNSTTKTQSVAEQLWNEAYDQLKGKNAKLIQAYEGILAKALSEDALALPGPASRDQLPQLLVVMTSKIESVTKTKERIMPFMHAVRSMKTTVGSAVSASREAALAWSAVCVVLEFLVNSTEESTLNRKGLEYVIQRLEFNNTLASLRLGDDETTTEEQKVRLQIRERLVKLYEHILAYLFKSVCYYNRNGLSVILRDAIKLDGWSELLQEIKDAEAAVDQDDASFKAYKNSRNLGELLDLAHKANTRALTAADAECLRQLRITDPRDDKKRIELAKGGLLQDSYKWILENEEYKTWKTQSTSLWIHGDPGKGKTMLLCGIIDEWQAEGNIRSSQPPLSFFFCQASDPRLNTAENVLRGLLYMMIQHNPELVGHVRTRFDKGGTGTLDDANVWIVLTEVFNEIIAAQPGMCLVVDALDECIYGRDLLLDLIKSSTEKVSWVVASRNWPEIAEALVSTPMGGVSLELNSDSVSSAVKAYINIKAAEIVTTKRLSQDTAEVIQDYLLKNAEGTFLWVSLVCHNLQKASRFQILVSLKSFPAGLDAVYQRMLEQLNDEDSEDVKTVLSIVSQAYRPLTLVELAAILPALEDISEKELWIVDIARQSGYLAIQESNEGTTVVFVHLSAKEFVLNKSGAALEVQRSKVHHLLFSRSIDLMDEHLRSNIYDLLQPSTQVETITIPSPDPLAAVSYSCSYWVDHLLAHFQEQPDLEAAWWAEYAPIHHFIRLRFLYWMESLSLLGNLTHGVEAILNLKQSLGDCKRDSEIRASEIEALISDMARFILSCNGLVAEYPLQLYSSALLFAPPNGSIREDYGHEIPQWLSATSKLRPWPDNVATYPVKWRTYDHKSRALTCSPDGKLVAIACDSRINIRSGITGASITTIDIGRTLQGGISFSYDGNKIAEASKADTVRYWSSTDARLVEMHQLTKLASVVAKDLAKESSDGFSPQQRFSFSPKGSWAAYASAKNVRVWSPNWKLLRTLSMSDSIKNLVVSSDEKFMAVCCRTNTIHVKDVTTGSEILKCSQDQDLNLHTMVLKQSPKALMTCSNDEIHLYPFEKGISEQSVPVEHCCDFGMKDSAYAWLNQRDTISDHRGHHHGRFAQGMWDASARLVFTSLWLVTVSVNKGGMFRLWDWDNVGTHADASGYITSNLGADQPERVQDLTISWDNKHIACLMSDSIAIWTKDLILERIVLGKHTCPSDTWIRYINNDHLLTFGLYERGDQKTRGFHIWSVTSSEPLETIPCSDMILGDLVSGVHGCLAWFSATETNHEQVVYRFKMMDKDSSPRTPKYELVEVARNEVDVYSCVAVSTALVVAVGRLDGTVDIWDHDLRQQESLGSVGQELKYPQSIAFSHDGDKLAIEYNSELVIWDLASRSISTIVTAEQGWNSGAAGQIFYNETSQCFRKETRCMHLPPGNSDIFCEEDWIFCGNDRMIKLPTDFQTSKIRLWDDDVFLAHQGGGASLIHIDREQWQGR